MIKWVKIALIAEQTGYTVRSLYNKINRGQLIENVHWRKAPDGNLLIHVENFNAWLEGREAA